MTKIAINRFLFAFVAVVAFGNSYATTATAKEEYELQERCGKRAEDLFKREFGSGISNTKDGKTISAYTNHYNKKLNKCFFLITDTIIPHKNKKVGISTMVTLLDINEQREYGTYLGIGNHLPDICKVSGVACHSFGEWEMLIKPYMED